MILEILLVFSIMGEQEEVSDKVFDSLDECATFVNDLVQQEVVNSDYSFRFYASDGLLFVGQCISKEDYTLSKEI